VYFFYIVKKYFKNFLLILFSLSFFLIIVDLIANFSKLPESSNLQVLYIYYVALYSVDVFYPLALVFSFLLTVYAMIKFNELVSFYSLGFVKSQILKPFLSFAFAVFAFFMVLDSGKFAYVREHADSILNKKQYSDSNLFLKYNDKIIYIKRIKPILKEADDLKVFFINNNKLFKIIYAPKAVFKNDFWHVKNAYITNFTPYAIKTSRADVKILKGFKPKIVANLKTLTSISLYDAYTAIVLFKDVNVNTLLSMVFYKVFTAFSLIGIIIILLFKSPIHQRISNVSLFLIKSVLFTILVWGMQLIIYKFAKQGVISPYILILPSVFIYGYGIYLIIKEKK